MYLVDGAFRDVLNENIRAQNVTPDPEMWNPRIIGQTAPESSLMPDDNLTALGVPPGLASTVVAMAINPRTVPPAKVEHVNACINFLGSPNCPVRLQAARVLGPLGIGFDTVFVAPSQEEWNRQQSLMQGRLEAWSGMLD